MQKKIELFTLANEHMDTKLKLKHKLVWTWSQEWPFIKNGISDYTSHINGNL